MAADLSSIMTEVGPTENEAAELEPGLIMLVADDPHAPKIVALWGQRELGDPEDVLEDPDVIDEIARLIGCPHLEDVSDSIERCGVAGVIQAGGPTDLGRLWLRALARIELGGRKPRPPAKASRRS